MGRGYLQLQLLGTASGECQEVCCEERFDLAFGSDLKEDRRTAWHSGVLGALIFGDSLFLVFSLRSALAQIATAC